MNAVKRCLALVAATLVVGACSGDPTAGDAGTHLTIRVTPGAVWMQQDKTTSVTIEAIDITGSPQPGSWTASTTGPVVATLNEDYQNTNGGAPVGSAQQFVISATAAGEGSVTFTGTGEDDVTVPVRIAPATASFEVVFTAPSTPVGDSIVVPLNTPVTITTPAGLRFTSTTAVRMIVGPLATNASFFTPINLSISSPDSTTLTFTPGPNSTGTIEVSGIVSLSTPTLKSTARTHTRLITDLFDTVSTSRITLSTATPAIGDTITVTLPATYRFSPNTAVTHFTDTVINGVPQRINTNGLATSPVVSVAADSGSLRYLVAPNARGRPSFSNIRVRATPAAWACNARTATSMANGVIPGPTISDTNPVVANTPVTFTVPVGNKLRPTSQARTTLGNLDAIFVSRSADSSTITVIPQPGFNQTIVLSNVFDSRVPTLNLALPTDGPIQTHPTLPAPNVLPNLGQDNSQLATPTGVVTVNLAVGQTGGFWDRGSWSAPDWFGWGGPNQDILLNVTNAGNYTVTLTWGANPAATAANSDVDFAILNFAQTATIGGFAGATGNLPEVVTGNWPAGSVWLLMGDFGHTKPSDIRVTIKRNS
jgi:hypothetical protein